MTNVQTILKDALENFSDTLSNAGCNDLELKDTPENRALVVEFEAWNVGVPVEEWPQHEDFHDIQTFRGKILTNDGLWIYLLKKQCGLL